MKIEHCRTSVYAIEYHIVFVTKYRRKVIEGNIKDDLYEVLRNVCKKNKTYQIQAMNVKDKLWNGHFWSPTYFIATVSENTKDQIKDYIESQGDR